jgi:hypothetical protein
VIRVCRYPENLSGEAVTFYSRNISNMPGSVGDRYLLDHWQNTRRVSKNSIKKLFGYLLLLFFDERDMNGT